MNVSGIVTDGSGAGWFLYARVTITGPGGPFIAFTNPLDGFYGPVTLQAGASYDFTVESLIPGYAPQTRTGVSHPGPSAKESFELLVDATTCSAPGYESETTLLLSEDFNGGIPVAWTVVDNSTACAAGIDVWSSTDLRPLFPVDSPIVTPPFAVINSDECGSTPTPNVITSLITPPLDLSALGDDGSVSLRFNSDYRDLCTAPGDAVTLEVGTYEAGTWTSLGLLQNFCGVTNRRNTAESFGTQDGNGIANARFRFHYDSGWDWWWAVDDVEIEAGSCSFQGGGLIWGFITDLSSGDPIAGATVSVDNTPAASTTSVATPDDPNLPDGYYVLPGDTGTRTVTATAPLHGPSSGVVTVSTGGLFRLDLALGSGDLDFVPNPLIGRAPVGGTDDVGAAVQNTGTASADFTLIEVNTPAPAPRPAGSPVAGRTEDAPLRLPGEKPFLSALSTRDFPPSPSGLNVPTPILAAGDVTATFDTGLPGGPYGNGVRQSSPGVLEVWLGNLAALAGPDENREFTSDKETFLTATGSVVAPVAAAVFYADMTYNSRTQSYWQINVGGDNCIHEFTETGFTGNTICPSFATSQRGVAYDPVTDTYFFGSFNDGAIVRYESNGTLTAVPKDVDTVGLAFNPLTCHLFAMQNTASPEADIVVMDACTPNFDFVGAFDLVDNFVSVMGDFEQGGLDMNCEGQLIADNFVTGQVFIADSGEGKSCLDIPWLTLDPASGTVPAPSPDAGSPGTIVVEEPVLATFDATQAPGPGCHQAHVLMESDTPEGTEVVPVFFTVAFLDVPAGHPFDTFIHALAGAGVTNGCGSGNFCPNAIITRAQMAVWLLRGRFGAGYTPPPATGTVFADVSPESFAADFIEQLAALGITAGCDASNFCPDSGVTREQMAVFLLRTLEGPAYVPPLATGIFEDVPAGNPFAPWIEELFHRGITAGCSTSPALYCPGLPVNRGTMSVFMTVTFDLPLCPAVP